MGCQKSIAKQIIDKQADYVFSLKGNHRLFHNQINMFFQVDASTCPGFDLLESTDGDRGRIEIRRYSTTDDINWIQGKEQ
jgi:predicted transposase YbfD/YdcC